MAERKLTVTLAANTLRFMSGFRSAEQVVQRVRRTVVRAAQLMSAAVVGVGVASVKMAIDFNRELTKLNTLVGISREQIDRWRGDIMRIAEATGQAGQELTKAMFAITSGGLRGAEALATLEQAARAGAIGLGDVTEIGRTATAALQAFGDEGLTAEKAIDVMVATVRAGNLVAEDLAGSLGRVIGIADTMGVSFEDLNAFIATFTRLGAPAEVAVTSLRAILTQIIKPTAEARATFDELGISIEQFRREIDENAAAALINLLNTTRGNIDTIGSLIPNVRALAGFLGTAGSQAETFAAIQQDVRNSLGLTAEGFEVVQQNAGFAMARLMEMGRNTFILIGQQLLPIVVEFANTMRRELPAMAQTTVRAVGAIGERLVEVVQFFRENPLGGRFGLVGLVFLGPAGAAGLAALGVGIDALTERLFGATSVAGRLQQNIMEAQREIDRLQESRRFALGDRIQEIDERIESLRAVIEMNRRTLEGIGDDGQSAFDRIMRSADELFQRLQGFRVEFGGEGSPSEVITREAARVGEAIGQIPEWVVEMNARVQAEFGERTALQRAMRAIRNSVRTAAEEVELQVHTINRALTMGLLTKAEAEELIQRVRETADGVTDEVDEMKEFVKRSAVAVGESLIEGIILGADNLKDMLARFFANLASKFIMQEILSVLDVGSPARALIPVGQSIVEGMMVGMSQMAGRLQAAAAQTATAAIPRRVPRARGIVGAGAVAGAGGGVTVLATVNINSASLDDARSQLPKMRRKLAEELTRTLEEDPNLRRRLLRGAV